MNKAGILRALSAGMVTAFVAGCADSPAAPKDLGLATGAAEQTFIVLSTGDALPATFATDVAALGGTITSSSPQIGMATVELQRANARTLLARVRGVGTVAQDVVMQFTDPNQPFESVEVGEEAIEVTEGGYGDADSFRAVQWAPDAISAPAAWATGALGRGARVAIIDGGVYSAHVDIAPNLDVARSRSFVAGFRYNQDVGTFWHGTHVAGIVGARGQGIGTVGIAPEATLIGVKVLHNGSGSFSSVLNGIVYSATSIEQGGAGADILNLSLGAGYPRQGRDLAQLSNALGRAVMYARRQGAVVVTAAGNSAIDLDHSANLVFFPGQAPGAINIASTGPIGWGVAGATVNFDRPASYTNYGQSAINFAAPGGDFRYAGGGSCTKPRRPSGLLTAPCFVFDYVMAPCRGGASSVATYCWAVGTSMAAPAVAGVAALVVGKFGKMAPARLEAILRASADDLGKPGQDDYTGAGRVNAFRAVQ